MLAPASRSTFPKEITVAKFRAEWILDDIEAENAAEAAMIALNIQKDPDSPATIFRVFNSADDNAAPTVVVLNMVEGNDGGDEAEIPLGTTIQ